MFPTIPNPHALVLLLVTAAALYLFSQDKIRLEITSLGLLSLLAVGFSVFPFEGVEPAGLFFGLGHEALISVCALMVLGQGIVVTGALEPVGRLLGRAWARLPFLSLFATLVVGAVLSAFVNNTPIVVLLLPILISACLRANASPTRVLMPMGFATLVGGMATTIGTSTNLLVVAVANDYGLERFGMFDFAVPAAIAGGIAILYLWLVAPRMLPERGIQLADSSTRLFDARITLSEASSVVGKTVEEATKAVGDGMRIIRIRRDDLSLYAGPHEVLRAGDRLRVRDTSTHLANFARAMKGTLQRRDSAGSDETPEGLAMAEVAVVGGSTLDRANLKSSSFLRDYELAVLALHRRGKDIWQPHEEIQDVVLVQGDVMLVQGPRNQIRRLKRNGEFLVLDATMELPRTRKAKVALAILTAVIVLAATGVMHIAVSAVFGALLMLATRCLRIGVAIRAISPAVFFVVAASLALGDALVKTGATQYLTDVFLFATAGATPTVILGALMMLLALLTNVVSNNAAAVIGTPIAIGIAVQLNLPPEPFVLAVLFGANMSFATPMAYKTNLLVMSAGGYRFSEFVRVGTPLTFLMWAVLTFLLASMYF
ncbi:MAG: SLC13 family permease [Gammaproteobacteria bacterium]|nr:SLC13 family permease [Gammaproteobacteria bacterium]